MFSYTFLWGGAIGIFGAGLVALAILISLIVVMLGKRTKIPLYMAITGSVLMLVGLGLCSAVGFR